MTAITTRKLVRGCAVLALGASSLLGTVAVGQNSAITTFPRAVEARFAMHFDRLTAGQQVSEVALNQGISGISTGILPLSLLGTSSVRIHAQRLNKEGDSNRAMIYNGECEGTAESCSGNDGDDLYQPGQGNLLIVSQDNDSSDPNDNHNGGHIDFDFSDFGLGAVTVKSIEVFDVSHKGAAVYLYADGELIKEVPIPRGDTGELSLVEIDTPGVDLMRVAAKDSFAVNDLLFETP
jgi:hypothetical protein